MAKLRDDFRLVRSSAGWFLVSVALAGGLWAASVYFRDEMDKEFNAEQNRFRAISQRYLSIDDEERIIRDVYPRFVSLYEGGVIGQERRLDWLESVRAARESVNLAELDLRLESQHIVAPDAAPANTVVGGDFELHGSTMHLNMGLLHEGDLLNFLDQIEADAPGLFSVTSCSLKRLNSEFNLGSTGKNLAADCELTWYTLDLRGGRHVSL